MEAISDSSESTSAQHSSPSTPSTEPESNGCRSPFNNLAHSSPLGEDRDYILVTGGLGYIGSHTSLELLKAGYSLIVIDNLSNSHLAVLDRIKTLVQQHYSFNIASVPTLDFHAIDYGDVVALRAILDKYTLSDIYGSRIVGVVHFAGHKSVTESIYIPMSYYKNNVASFLSLLETLNDYGIKTIIFSSSAAVYGAKDMDSIGEEYCPHGEEIHSLKSLQGFSALTSPYGRTKWMCEAILSDLCVGDPDWRAVALRYFNPVGCDPSGLLGEDPLGIPNNLMPIICKVLRGDISHLNVFGSDYDTKDGTGVRDFIHVTDLANAHLAALTVATSGQLRTPFRSFNVGSGTGHSVLELVETMRNVSMRDIPLQFTARRKGDVAISVAKSSRAETELNWKTHRSLLDSCRDTFNFFSKNPMGYRE